jgi:hypothetical protein
MRREQVLNLGAGVAPFSKVRIQYLVVEKAQVQYGGHVIQSVGRQRFCNWPTAGAPKHPTLTRELQSTRSISIVFVYTLRPSAANPQKCLERSSQSRRVSVGMQ